MKVAYIAHPIGGDVENNLAKIRDIVRNVNLTEKEVVPFAPYYADVVSLDDAVPEERNRGLQNDHHLLDIGIIDELRLYGGRISEGMMAEAQLAHRKGIQVIPMCHHTRIEWYEFLLGHHTFEHAHSSMAIDALADQLTCIKAVKDFSTDQLEEFYKILSESDNQGFELLDGIHSGYEKYEDASSLEMYFEQTTNGGFTGDHFAGTMAVKLPSGRYLMWNYSM
ncbi:DUF7768 domain-containing protein [Sanyastnella coralliicola]|uniref:DUF7768 domain-containing protein n=1 Tax=Sanyastnella coralliicola TaxID=3069118 RepID=UPI0027B97DF1|nr:hypothetical protein [Longitalea sp. SCSIO 12813]